MQWQFLYGPTKKMLSNSEVKKDQGGYSQNFLRQILKIFITLGLNILRFYRPKVFFKANISKV